ncbi:DUF2631 domain-containing protein [Natronoglycomyces albus]|uniref:DUF2631 domain-containing protein n=1 Tax=Natronoglycomyces albus TaxID=2811108 RepID=A0A895XSL1_9ACTN|nr:DUF2631 domain-containing protein [Natronoglycomyces albus]QSB06225.1 DUF2631 domain-containing protein [Natronoglycomyces albus]
MARKTMLHSAEKSAHPEVTTMAGGEEPVLSPAQRKPTSRKVLYSTLLVTAGIVLTFLLGNHTGRIEDFFVILTAAGIVGFVVLDWWMRRTGLRD